MGRVSLCLVIMFFICSAQKIDAQVQNIREKQDTISATKSLEHIRPENIKKGPLNNALDVLSGQSAGVNVTTNGTDRLAMLNSIRVRGTTGSPDKPGGLSIQLCKSEKKEFYIRYSS